MRSTVFVLMLTLLMAATTIAVGWWAVPIVGFGWGASAPRHQSPGLTAGNAGGLSWALLLAWTSTQGPVGSLARSVGAAMGLPGPILFVLAIAFAVITAASAAVVGAGVRRLATKKGPVGQRLTTDG